MLKFLKVKNYNKLLDKIKRYENLINMQMKANEELIKELVEADFEIDELQHKINLLEEEYENLKREHEKQRQELFVKNRMLSYVKTLRRLGK